MARKIVVEENRPVSSLVEGAMTALAARRFPTYYIKAEKEVDIVLSARKKFLPIDVKWAISPNPAELKQLLKYKNGIVAAKGRSFSRISSATLIPIPVLACLF